MCLTSTVRFTSLLSAAAAFGLAVQQLPFVLTSMFCQCLSTFCLLFFLFLIKDALPLSLYLFHAVSLSLAAAERRLNHVGAQ